jgi:diguanylate cyclase (GGDEF)-like protein
VHGWWRWYLGCGLLALAAGMVLPAPVGLTLSALIATSAAAATVLGVRRHRPVRARAWWLFCAGIVCSIVGGVVWTAGLPEAGDVVFLAAYPFFAGGLAIWVRRDPTRSRWESMVDACIVASGAAALSWAFVVDPLMDNADVPPNQVVNGLAHAILDLVIISLGARLVLSVGARTRSYTLVITGAAALLAGDYAYFAPLGWTAEPLGAPLSGALWILAYLLFAAGALHPSMAGSTGQLEWPQLVTSRFRLGLYTLLAIIGPGVTVLRLVGVTPDEDGDDHRHLVIPLGISVVTAVLLVVRLALLVRVAHRRAVELDQHTIALSASLREQDALRQQLVHRALHDALTGLGNRALLQERLEHALIRDTNGEHGLLLLDLDGFKDVNDSFGHPVGDALLIDVAARLLGVVGAADTLVRLGGDEFAILLEDVPPERVAQVASAVVGVIREPFVIADRELCVTTSVGTLTVRPPTTMPDALRNVDLALYAAKNAGKNQVVGYEPRMSTELRAHLRLATALRRAVAREEFTVHYQPVVDLTTGRVTAVEALLRWTPDGVSVPPAEFIPVAEQAGLIVPIGEWVLRQACRDALHWHTRFGIAVTVNVSGRQLREPGFATTVVRALRDTGLPGEALILEITETVLVATTSVETDGVTALLSALRAEGVRIAVDDFGTGYSSLAYLRHLPVDILKIDRAFTPDGNDGNLADEMAFTRAILELGSSLRLQSIAEAVETPEQAQRLRQLHCPLAQGYHFSRPLPADALDRVLEGGGGRLDPGGYAPASPEPSSARIA